MAGVIWHGLRPATDPMVGSVSIVIGELRGVPATEQRIEQLAQFPVLRVGIAGDEVLRLVRAARLLRERVDEVLVELDLLERLDLDELHRMLALARSPGVPAPGS